MNFLKVSKPVIIWKLIILTVHGKVNLFKYQFKLLIPKDKIPIKIVRYWNKKFIWEFTAMTYFRKSQLGQRRTKVNVLIHVRTNMLVMKVFLVYFFENISKWCAEVGAIAKTVLVWFREAQSCAIITLARRKTKE